ncbi:hypothetical protein [Pseudomonas putida]|uniref:DUF7831 domain-containing protein n=1 Tax=Pseudomonas putida TaxID=303 RepID=A0A8I1JHR4_PSEPU|nr:hypothetical protein [Pseudomonas putida]
MKVRYEKKITVEMCRAHPDAIFVYGDNLIHKGKALGAGQAVIRDEPNAMGIPTKRLPSTKDDAYFSDQEDELKAVRDALAEIYKRAKGKTIFFPKDGVGTGRAKMKEKSPRAWARMNEILDQHFDIQNAGYSSSPKP